jgi:ABC-type multidrug transport system fused ATPase/permease subunit
VTSVSAAVVFLGLFRQGMVKIQSFGMVYIQYKNSWKILGDLMQDIMNLKPPVVSGPKKFISLHQSISCKNLTFSYDKTPVLKNVSLTIPAHKMTVITGENGSGKSTLISLILRFYDCPQETLFLDGEDIHIFDIVSWRSKIAYVAQDVILFHGTLRENLTY